MTLVLSCRAGSVEPVSPWTSSSLQTFYTNDLAAFATAFPALPAPSTNRTHCIAWSDYVTQAQVQQQRGIRFDTNYYYWPGASRPRSRP